MPGRDPATDPLVSIGVPVYNGEKYLSECLESILKQSYERWECFVLDNHSMDKSAEIAKSFENLDSRFKLVANEEFVPMVTNFNNTFHCVSKEAKYFKVVCADDWLFPEYLVHMIRIMEDNPEAGMASSYRLDSRAVRCDGLDFYLGPVFRGRDVLEGQLMQKYDVTGSETTVFYRMETLKQVKTYPDIYDKDYYHFDTALAYELLNISELAFVFQVLSFTRRHEETYTSQISNRYNTSLNFLEKELFKYKNGNPVLEKEYRKVRTRYGYFLFRCRLSFYGQCMKWHRDHMDPSRNFTFSEMIFIVTRTLLGKVVRTIMKLNFFGKKTCQ